MPADLSDVELFERLVEIDSTSANSNLPIADRIADYLDRAGVRIERNFSDDRDKVNLLAWVGPPAEESRAGLTLSAHMDVVPAGDGWGSDPFSLTDAGDRWVGRGTADMKGFLALAVDAAAKIDPQSLRAPLALALTFDEELGCLGAEHLAKTWHFDEPLPRAAVIGEPTELRVVRMHKGHLKMRFRVEGVSAHSGYPHLGVNAIEPAGRLITALSALRRDLERERPEHSQHFPDTPFVALNVARVRGGTAINVVPEECVVEIGLRLLPGMRSEPIVERVREAAGGALTGIRYAAEVVNEAPPMLAGEEAPIYRALCEMTGQRETVSASYGTDAAWLQELGLDCVVFGPGSIEVAHKPNEYLTKSDFAAGRRYVERLIDRFCRAA